MGVREALALGEVYPEWFWGIVSLWVDMSFCASEIMTLVFAGVESSFEGRSRRLRGEVAEGVSLGQNYFPGKLFGERTWSSQPALSTLPCDPPHLTTRIYEYDYIAIPSKTSLWILFFLLLFLQIVVKKHDQAVKGLKRKKKKCRTMNRVACTQWKPLSIQSLDVTHIHTHFNHPKRTSFTTTTAKTLNESQAKP